MRLGKGVPVTYRPIDVVDRNKVPKWAALGLKCSSARCRSWWWRDTCSLNPPSPRLDIKANINSAAKLCFNIYLILWQNRPLKHSLSLCKALYYFDGGEGASPFKLQNSTVSRNCPFCPIYSTISIHPVMKGYWPIIKISSKHWGRLGMESV
jgi:hypothetical protein